MQLRYLNVTDFGSLRTSDIELAILLTNHSADLNDVASHFIDYLLPQVSATESVRVVAQRASESEQVDESYFEQVLSECGLNRSGVVRCQYIDAQEGPGGPSSRFALILK